MFYDTPSICSAAWRTRSSQAHFARRGFTLAEMTIVMLVIAVIAAAVIPAFQKDQTLRVMAASSILASDIEYAQVLNIAQPETPVVVRFDVPGNRYWLAYADTPDTPIPREDTGEPYLVELGFARAKPADGVTMTLSDLDDNTLEFDSQGALVEFMTNPMILLQFNGNERTLVISPQTGSVTELAGNQLPPP